MKTRYLILIAGSFLLGFAVDARTVYGAEVRDEPFHIAGGQTVSLPMTDRGPVSAENDDIKIEVSGFGIFPSKEAPKRAMLAWGFDFTVKSSDSLDHVTVEEVYPSDVARLIVDDQKPVLNGKTWSGNPPPIVATPSSIPWMFDVKTSIFVFRYTITPVGKPPIVLYQPAMFSRSAKEAMQQLIGQLNAN